MIKAVYPDAFNLSRQSLKLPMSREKSYELVIEVPDHTKSVEREKKFHDCLIERTKLHHQVRALSWLNFLTRLWRLTPWYLFQQFLEQYDPTLKISASDVKKWHREFNLNDVPDIEPIPLPQPPSTHEVGLSAKDVLGECL